MTAEVEFRGLAEYLSILDALDAANELTVPMTQATAAIHETVAVYPPATEANRPGRPQGWYERGKGWYSSSGKLYPTSETMGRRWTSRVEQGGRVGRVGNTASYVRYVQDRLLQARFHTARGWITAQDAIEKRTNDIIGYFARHYERVINMRARK